MRRRHRCRWYVVGVEHLGPAPGQDPAYGWSIVKRACLADRCAELATSILAGTWTAAEARGVPPWSAAAPPPAEAERRLAAPAACCGLHRPGTEIRAGMGPCCDTDDCGPCCDRCPTCPSLSAGTGGLSRQRQLEQDRLAAMTERHFAGRSPAAWPPPVMPGQDWDYTTLPAAAGPPWIVSPDR